MGWDDRLYRWRWWILVVVAIVLGIFLGYLPRNAAEAHEWLETILGAFRK